MEGGFPRPSSIGVIGDIGAGKSFFCRQIMWNALRQGFNVLFYLTEESKDEMEENISRYGWDIDKFDKNGKLKIVDIFSKGVELARESVMEPEVLMKKSFNFFEILKEGRTYYFNAIRGEDLIVIFDSLSTIFLAMETKNALAFLQNLKLATRVARCIGIAALHSNMHDEKIENVCKSAADGILEMKMVEKEDKITRLMRILKMSRTDFYQGTCVYTAEKDGLKFSKVLVH